MIDPLVGLNLKNRDRFGGKLINFAIGLLSQQAWCWGRDVIRPEGNWLLEIGFARTEPPADRKDCSSVYVLDLPEGQQVVLRGFGVFFGDPQRGGVFLPRYKFRPRYTPQGRLDKPPWASDDLPKLSAPTASSRAHCASLAGDLIDWIKGYELNVVNRLGVEYRRASLEKWDDGKRPVILAEDMVSAWENLGAAVAEDFQAVMP